MDVGVARTDSARTDTQPHNGVVDLVRGCAIVVVVVGHWLMAALFLNQDGVLRRADILGLATWAHPLTWVLQVMPLFFVVGGYVNAISWRHAMDRGDTYGGWLRHRLRRLYAPLLPLMLFWAVVAPAASAWGVSESTLRLVTRASLVPTWFLAVYALVVSLVPASLWLWDRFGLWTIALSIVGAALVDVATMLTAHDAIGLLNLGFVWAMAHQLGYAWVDGSLGGTGRRLLLGIGGLATTVTVVWLGPYSVSMVGVEGYGANNTYPPRVTLALLAIAQTGLVTALEPALRRFVARLRVRRVVLAVNLRIMTIYLWHLTALTILVAISLALDGYGLHPVPDTVEWWQTRVAWCLALAAVTAVPVAVLGRFELPRPDPRPPPSGIRMFLAMLATGLAVAWMADSGITSSDGTVDWQLPLLPLLTCFGLGIFAWPHGDER